MLDWLRSFGDSAPSVGTIRKHFLEMLQDGRHVFDAASNALLAGGDASLIREDLYKTDQHINKTEQRVRREILVHGLVHGASTFPELLVLMSVAKDAERIGDYAKNIYELTSAHADLAEDEVAVLNETKITISHLLARAHGLFGKSDEAAAKAFLEDADEVQKLCDAAVLRLLTHEGENKAGAVLVWRYFKRVASHAGNIVTSLVVSVDKLDFYPGKPESEQ